MILTTMCMPSEECADRTDDIAFLQLSKADVAVIATSQLGFVRPHVQHEPGLLSTDAESNITLKERIVTEIEFEIRSPDAAFPLKNKVILVLLEAFIYPACCGIDRCYMGQPLIGIAKAVTFGGLGIWGTIDFFVVLMNALSNEQSLDSLGFHAQFGAGQIAPAWYIASFMLAFIILTFCCGGTWRTFVRKADQSLSLTANLADRGEEIADGSEERADSFSWCQGR